MSTIAPNYRRTKFACYASYFTMSSIFSLPPLLFVTLRQMYGISYTLLGTLVLVNFCTQLAVDLIFTVFSKHFSVSKVLRTMPLITMAGLIIYALIPTLFPQYAYVGLLTGTIIFSIAAGLSEVLLSPTIAALPSDNPQRDMSLLHSLFAFGFFTIVTVSTLFLKFFGTENWAYLTFFLALLPIIPSVLFMISPIPDMSGHTETATREKNKTKTFGLALCVACIFFGSCAENAMSSWISSFLENALHMDKAMGDILGVAMFAVLLGIARILYAKFGKNICKVLLLSMIGASVCYLVAGLSSSIVFAFTACLLAGFFTSMLWPGSLIMMEENLPGVGVAAFALMAAGGDLGASVAPQLMGIVIDKVTVSRFASNLSVDLGISAEQVGLKTSMLVCSAFPIIGTLLILFIIRYFKKHTFSATTE